MRVLCAYSNAVILKYNVNTRDIDMKNTHTPMGEGPIDKARGGGGVGITDIKHL